MLTVAVAASACAKKTVISSMPDVKYMMVIDQNRCTGCQACSIACKAENDTFQDNFNTRVLKEEISDKAAVFTPVQCNHCEEPMCVAACPVDATFKLSNGIVVTDWEKCDGIGECVGACPYNARFFDDRYKGKAGSKVDKCDFCISRLSKGLMPACVETCPSGARLFGNAKMPSGEFAKYLEKDKLISRFPELRIETSLKYKKSRKN
ncbi:4Fe-4S dicluster domain-containing protein [Seleniivibrio woodruffii]|uniref:4Fe-4S dicluster domain-containing protein n=1 Tax=Seleniivibrio woodruffii TaxID=1078050 RepID=UPI001A9DED13|nr:4Fe-4S dicluster domain-containing protein [Seleniivibrio woodruffii]